MRNGVTGLCFSTVCAILSTNDLPTHPAHSYVLLTKFGRGYVRTLWRGLEYFLLSPVVRRSRAMEIGDHTPGQVVSPH